MRVGASSYSQGLWGTRREGVRECVGGGAAGSGECGAWDPEGIFYCLFVWDLSAGGVALIFLQHQLFLVTILLGGPLST